MLIFGVIVHGMANLELTSCQWDKILTFLRRSRSDLYIGREDHCRRFAAGVLWIARSGAPWRFRPAEYGNWNSVYKRCAGGATGAFGRRCLTIWPMTRITSA